MTLVDYMQSDLHTKEEKIVMLDGFLMSTLPGGVEGDKVTFIGSVFFRVGEPDSYLNHCVALGTCDDVPNSTIERCESEEDLLLAWKRVIVEENPDIIIGYNTFRFDYQFMFKRSLELHIVGQFLPGLAKNRADRCHTVNREGILSIAESKTRLASGDFHLHYIDMIGRMQVDLFTIIRREYNLPSYKLDYVAGHFLGDKVIDVQEKMNVDADEDRPTKGASGAGGCQRLERE